MIDNPGLQQLLRDLGIDLQLPNAVNVAPTENIALLRAGEAGNTLEPARWWLTPAWAPQVDQKYSMFNARSETLSTSRAFRRPFASQRGIVPMSSFIEWRPEGGVKQPWLISNERGALAVAALWDVWDRGDSPLLSCTLVTTEAAPAFAPWHKRMPVLLADEECARWMDNQKPIVDDDPIFCSVLKSPLRLVPLSRAVSNARNKDPRVLEGVADVVELPAGADGAG